MLRRRVIPVLLIKERKLVKTINFKNEVYLGDPVNAIKIFNEKEVDEIIILDINAAKSERGVDWNLLNRLNVEAFMPLGYGGGIKNISDIQRIIAMGYEKVVLNSAVLLSSKLVAEASLITGSQSIVICVDICKTGQNTFKVYDYIRMKATDLDPMEYCKKLEDLGAGEIIIQSFDREGTYSGYETEYINMLSSVINIPVIALGGASSISDIKQILQTNISGAAAGSLFVFFGRLKAVLINYPSIKCFGFNET